MIYILSNVISKIAVFRNPWVNGDTIFMLFYLINVCVYMYVNERKHKEK